MALAKHLLEAELHGPSKQTVHGADLTARRWLVALTDGVDCEARWRAGAVNLCACTHDAEVAGVLHCITSLTHH
jgi:hypothetical protein